MGWILRGWVIILLSFSLKARKIMIVCFRDVHGFLKKYLLVLKEYDGLVRPIEVEVIFYTKAFWVHVDDRHDKLMNKKTGMVILWECVSILI